MRVELGPASLTRPDWVLVAVDLRGLDSVEDFIDRLLFRLSTTGQRI
jgi:hypothetical protein